MKGCPVAGAYCIYGAALKLERASNQMPAVNTKTQIRNIFIVYSHVKDEYDDTESLSGPFTLVLTLILCSDLLLIHSDCHIDTYMCVCVATTNSINVGWEFSVIRRFGEI